DAAACPTSAPSILLASVSMLSYRFERVSGAASSSLSTSTQPLRVTARRDRGRSTRLRARWGAHLRSGNVLEGADIGPRSLRAMRPIEVTGDRWIYWICCVNGRAAWLQMEIIIGHVSEHRISGCVPDSSDTNCRSDQVVLIY